MALEQKLELENLVDDDSKRDEDGGGRTKSEEDNESDTETKKKKILRFSCLKFYEILLIVLSFIIMAATYGITFINSLIIIAILIAAELAFFILISIIYGLLKCCKLVKSESYSYCEFITNSVCIWYSAQLISIFFVCTILIVSHHPYWTGKFEEIFLNPSDNDGVSFRPYFQVNEYKALFLEPNSPSEIQDIIINYGIKQNRTIRAVGSGHSSADLLTNDIIISLNKFTDIQISSDNKSIIAGAGITVLETENYLYDNGEYVLLGFGSAQFQRLPGMLGTGVYGAFGSMNKYLLSVWMVDGNGNDIYIKKGVNDTLLAAVKVNVGLLGIIYRVEFAIQKSFNVKADVDHYLHSKFHALSQAQFDDVMKIDRNISGEEYIGVKVLMFPWDYSIETFRNIGDSEPANIIDYERNDVVRDIMNNIILPVSCFLPDCIEWGLDMEFDVELSASENNVYAVKSALRTLDAFWCSGMYAIPYKNCKNMMVDLQEILDDYWPATATIIPLLQSDDYGYLSYGYDQSVCMVEFYPKLCDGNRLEARRVFETEILEKYNGTIHFAKRYLFTPKNVTMNRFYSKINDWKSIREQMDPNNIFVNDYLGKYFEINGYRDKYLELTLLDQYNQNAEGWTYAGWFALFLSAVISIIMSFVVFRNDDYLSNLYIYNPKTVHLNTKKSFAVLACIIIFDVVVIIIVFFGAMSTVD